MSWLCSSTLIKSRSATSALQASGCLLWNLIKIYSQAPLGTRRRKLVSSLRQITRNLSKTNSWLISTLINTKYFRNHSFISSRPLILNTNVSNLFYWSCNQKNGLLQNRPYSTSAASTDENEVKDQNYPPERQRTKEELLGLVDYCDKDYSNDQSLYSEREIINKPSRTTNRKLFEISEDDSETPPTPPPDLETAEKLHNLNKALSMDKKNLDEIFQLYKSLPDTRVQYLHSSTRHKLLHVLSVVEFKSEHTMLRYLAVVDDLKASQIPLTISEWNSALSHVARHARITTVEEVEAALCMWREMEHGAGVRGNNVTFNILFDVAYRAGKFNLAQMIYTEMAARDLQYNRYHYVTYIMYHGMRQDGNAVRAAYQQFIEAGEIVDTLVLNAMLSALIQSLEPNSAENLYQRMKKAHLARADPQIPPKHFEGRRAASKALLRATRLTEGDKVKREELQRRSIIGPDSLTYLILLEHFSVKDGNLDKTATLLEEMKWFALPVYGNIFVKIFKGFSAHGGVPYSRWTGARLELVFKSFLTALESEDTDLFLSWGIVLWILRAFGKCQGPSRALSVWEDLRSRWEPDSVDVEYLTSDLNYLTEMDSVQKRRSADRKAF